MSMPPSPTPSSVNPPWARASVALLVALQLLLAVVVITALWFGSQRLRTVALEHMHRHAQVQAHNLEDRLTQSFELLQAHLLALDAEQPGLFEQPRLLHAAFLGLLDKLPWLRSLSLLDGEQRVQESTDVANLGLQLALEPMLPALAAGTPGVLRFGPPWHGRDFATGARWSPPGASASLPPDAGQDAGFFPLTMVLPGAPQWTVLAAVNSEYFINQALNHQVSRPLHHHVFNDHGVLLFSTVAAMPPGSLLPAGRRTHVLAQQIGAEYWEDGRAGEQLVAFRLSRAYPWFVLSQAATDEVLVSWRRDTRNLALSGAALMALLLLSTSYLTWRVKRSLQREARLHEANRLAEIVFAHSSDLIVITDGRERVLAVNPAYEELTGFAVGELQAQRAGWLASVLTTPAALAAVRQALATESAWQGEITASRKDGSSLPGWLSLNLVRDAGGGVAYHVGVLRDLSRLRADEVTIRQLSKAVEQSPSSIVITSTDAIIEYANAEFFRATGYSREEVIGVNPRLLQSGLTPPAVYREMWARLRVGEVWHGEFTNRRKDGSLYVESASVAPLIDASGQTTHYLGIKHDISAQKENEKSLRLAASVIASTHDGILICDEQQRILEVNPAFEQITGYAATEVLGKHPGLLSAGRKYADSHEAMEQALSARGHWQGEFWNRRKDGSLYAIFSTVNAISDDKGAVSHYISVFSDITERKQQERELASLAHFDPLTGLPNRTLLDDRFRQALARARRERSMLAVGFIDLDGFKAVNDRHGHEAGDSLLVTLAERLQGLLRADDTVARLGGDEFIVLLGNLREDQHWRLMAQRLLAAISAPVKLADGVVVQVSGSLGISLYPRHSDDPDTLLRHADEAMYRAKQGGRNRCALHGDEEEGALLSAD